MWVRLKVIRFRILVLTPIARIPDSTIGVQEQSTGALPGAESLWLIASGDLQELRKAEQLFWRFSTAPRIE